MAAAPLVLPPLACVGSTERRPEGPAGRGSSLLATPMSSGWWLSTRRAFPQQEGSRGATARAPKLLLAWVAVKAVWTVTRSDF